jgi:acyl carrier protein
MPELLTRLKDVMREYLPQDAEDITTGTHLVNDLGFDSLDRVELAIGLEDKFEIADIRDEDVTGWQTVGDILAYLETAKAQ